MERKLATLLAERGGESREAGAAAARPEDTLPGLAPLALLVCSALRTPDPEGHVPAWLVYLCRYCALSLLLYHSETSPVVVVPVQQETRGRGPCQATDVPSWMVGHRKCPHV